MILVRKADGTTRSTVDLWPLNRHCLRETHHVKPPYQQARAIPKVRGNGYHSVPIHEDDRHLTTSIILWGCFHYRVVPHRFKASGDGYTRRFDEIIQDIFRITKCVDYFALCDESLEGHWWRIIDFIELLGRHGIVLNTNKVSVCPNRSTICWIQHLRHLNPSS